jgi:hypothetical protein
LPQLFSSFVKQLSQLFSSFVKQLSPTVLFLCKTVVPNCSLQLLKTVEDNCFTFFNYSKQLRTTVLHFSSWVRARFAHVSGLFSTSIRLGFRLDQLLKGMAEQHSEIPEDGLCLLYGRGVGL